VHYEKKTEHLSLFVENTEIGLFLISPVRLKTQRCYTCYITTLIGLACYCVY